MYISEIRIENFRLFGGGEDAFVLHLNPGLTALVGDNDVGKTAIIDAIRYVLRTTDQEYVPLEPTDFYQSPDGKKCADQISIRCRFDGLTVQDRGAFAEYLSYETRGTSTETVLFVVWLAKKQQKNEGARRHLPIEWRSGEKGDGPLIELGARSLLNATYLRPLRDAERAMSAGRGSRLSQILQHTPEIQTEGTAFDHEQNPSPDPAALSVLGIGDFANHLLGESEGIKKTRQKLNDLYLSPLSFKGAPLNARISVSRMSDDVGRLRQLLEKLEVNLSQAEHLGEPSNRGLGSNNLLFMACELLLLGVGEEEFPLLLIEEPEAHLHPQRQLLLMGFLQDQIKRPRADGQQIQIIVTTHSPNLASYIKLDNLVLIRDRKAFSLARGKTMLDPSDYRFLERFLDVTKANLFFAKGVVIVEGDAENLLLPTLARLLGRDFREYGVSLIKVGGIGLRRYSRIFMRANEKEAGMISTRVACIADLDVMPDCAAWIVRKMDQGKPLPQDRRWKVKSDFANDLTGLKGEIRSKSSCQNVETFVADEWTLEYDLAFAGLAEEVWIAAHLASKDEDIHAGKTKIRHEVKEARRSFADLCNQTNIREEIACHIYSCFTKGASKAIAAQYLAEIIEWKVRNKKYTPSTLRANLPPYLVNAIAYVTSPFEQGNGSGKEAVSQSG
ncbi:MAG TPA: AAA family ATPase [Candidatus Acidoferrales bacterium]|nr:AAA family ATPase [Candidatus Acidoferrales bacterium]